MYGVRHLEKTIRFSLKSRPSERFHWPKMSQIKAEISLCTNVKLIFHKNSEKWAYYWKRQACAHNSVPKNGTDPKIWY